MEHVNMRYLEKRSLTRQRGTYSGIPKNISTI